MKFHTKSLKEIKVIFNSNSIKLKGEKDDFQ